MFIFKVMHFLQKLMVRCVAVINDTVGALLAGAHLDEDCQIGIILGNLENLIILPHNVINNI